jgi:hypothetical protein
MVHLCDVTGLRGSPCGTIFLDAVLFEIGIHAVVDCVIVLW